MSQSSFPAAAIVDFSEAVDDRVAALLVQGTGITLTYNDGAGTLTITSSGGGVTDHGALTGLSDNDHPQYALLAGATFSGAINVNAAYGGTHQIRINSLDGSDSILLTNTVAAAGFGFQMVGVNAFLWNYEYGSLVFAVNNQQALEIAPSRDVTFAGNIIANNIMAKAISSIVSSGSNILHISCGAGAASSLRFEENGTPKFEWYSLADKLRLFNFATSADMVEYDGATNSAAFAGNVAVGGAFTLAMKTIATLPSAAASSGKRYRVSDSATTTGRQVFSNGTAWYYEDGSPV